MHIKELSAAIGSFNAAGKGPSFATEEFMGKLVLAVVILALSAGAASAQGYGYGYGYGNGYAAPVADLAPPAYGYAAPGYGYAAPAYGYAAPVVAPAQAGTTIIIVTPGAPAYTAPSGYYAAPSAWLRGHYIPTHPAIGADRYPWAQIEFVFDMIS